MAREKAIPPLDFNEWITEQYIRAAYKAKSLDYEKDLASINDPKVTNAALPMEIWHAKDGIKTYSTTAEFLKAVAEFRTVAQKLNATYVYDKETGLKLFGKMAFYVKAKDGVMTTFLRKEDAEAYASTVGGKVIGFEEAIGSMTG